MTTDLQQLLEFASLNPGILSVTLSQMALFHQLASLHRRDIILTLHARTNINEPPTHLSPSLNLFLSGACELTPDETRLCWLLLRHKIWDTSDVQASDPAQLRSIHRIHGDPIGLTYTALYPPNLFCYTPGCRRSQILITKAMQRKAVIYTLSDGVVPTYHIHMYCEHCKTGYHNNFYVRNGRRFYYTNPVPEYLQVGTHHFAERRLVKLWTAQLLYSRTSAFHCAQIYNYALKNSPSMDPDWGVSPTVRCEEVSDAFTLLSLLEDCEHRNTVLEVAHTGLQKDRFTAAVQARDEYFEQLLGI
ncbi:hypothetical protein EVG20_g1111 [Dentipellis fragilis]|uniref:CxC5 like cysteine cluster associated with KDZ domain-containing protein n=1 Tax=Dentipellis fragilis TaxID=205917 RepID=A0A4Y9ZBQ5_9AGAM|nr:hypothetical protein EVG20_g1111 [Dentipellis fragilis]